MNNKPTKFSVVLLVKLMSMSHKPGIQQIWQQVKEPRESVFASFLASRATEPQVKYLIKLVSKGIMYWKIKLILKGMNKYVSKNKGYNK